jgi:uncharacterized protein YjlB
MMDKNMLEIKRYEGEGYHPLINFGTWRVAFLRWEACMQAEKIDRMERHTQTDEVFVLLHGQATLILGGNASAVDGIYPQEMKMGSVYNVKQGAWHTVLPSRDASILIVEESNTGEENTEYCNLADELRFKIMELG